MNLILIVLLPLLSAIICGTFKDALPKKAIGIIASSLLLVSAILSVELFVHSISHTYFAHIKIFNWLKLGSLNVDWSIYADHLTLIMYLVVCGVSAMVHIYSIGYMIEDPRFNLFMAYISLFTFFMLMLVSADNLVQLFFGWEGVGLCSYLLIGFWYTKDSANNAAQKAFIVNRFADVAMLVGVLLIYSKCGSLNFTDISANYHLLQDVGVLDLTCLLLFIGCMGKSAQIGLHVWLPDAMEGPTPVSALIHAATMVTAGIFLVARMHFLFENSYTVSTIITYVGGITCIFAALIAVTQTDIKKIIAYSTCSQLGYMFIACGVGAYHAAMFHLATHAFYKALLFLSAGNVIHGTGEQELDKIGNVRGNMKFTFVFFMIGSVAIMGIPPFAGFYSKDLILEYAHQSALPVFVLGILAAFYTGFYSLKILKNIFTSASVNHHAHEASFPMLLAMVPLILGSVVSGYIGVHLMLLSEQGGYFGHIFKIKAVSHEAGYIAYAPFLSGLLGAIFGYTNSKHGLLQIAKHKFYFDEIYNYLAVKPLQLIAVASALFDKYGIDKLGPGNSVALTQSLSDKVTRYHTGYIFSYGLWILISLLLITTYFLVTS